MIKLDVDTIIEYNSLTNSKKESLEGSALIDFIRKDKTKVKLTVFADVGLPDEFCERNYKTKDIEKYIENLDNSDSFSVNLSNIGNVFAGEYISKHYDTICNLLVNFMNLYDEGYYDESDIEDILDYMSEYCIYATITAIED